MSNDLISHAFVVPDHNFFGWLDVLQPYLAHFERVAVVRSPAGNDLSPYRNVTAVAAPRTWQDDDPLRHIRRIYPQVVRVDVIDVDTPQALAPILQRRVANDDRYGLQTNTPKHVFDRFVLEWATDYRPMRVIEGFSPQPGTGDDVNMGVDIAASAGAAVLAGAAGTVTRQWAGSQPDELNLGKYVQVTTQINNTTYRVTYAGLRVVGVPLNIKVSVGDQLGEAAGERLKIIVQQDGGSSGYRLPNIINPMPMLYVTNLRVRPTVAGLRVRAVPGTEGKILGQIYPWDMLVPKEMHGRTLSKVGSDTEANEWLRIELPDGRDGYTAAWFLQADVYRKFRFAGVNPVGVNLDQLHPLGKPSPLRLGNLGWVRMGYNVSNNTGSEDIQAAYDRYAPLAEQYVRAGYKVLFTTSHQTYGEGKQAFWPWTQMTDAKWAQLTARFAEMMGRIAQQWAGKGLVHCWQVWNEQDAPIGATSSVPMSMANYRKMLMQTVPAIRSADRGVYVITGGHTAGPGRGSDYARGAVGTLPAGAQVDGIAIHPYGRGATADSPYAQFGSIDESMRAYLPILPQKPIWITEWGVLDKPTAPASAIATYATDFISHMKGRYRSHVACMIWYAWAEGMHNGYGIVDGAGNPRPPLTEQFLRA